MRTLKTFIAGLLLMTLVQGARAQQVNGAILFDTLNLKAVKIWGNHHERGYALGFLLAQDISQTMVSYIKPILGTSYNTARTLVTDGNDLNIDNNYIIEAQGVIDGMNACGYNPNNLDATDVLVGNCLLDLMKLLGMKSKMGCSSLMDWGDATQGTNLGGKSVITRHLDWQSNAVLLNNQLMVVSQPSEAGEQPWIMIGFAGMISALSGVNATLGCFQHVMDDFTTATAHNMHFTPVWFAMRKALESIDYNGDGSCNVQDVRSSLLASVNGFADGYIVTALSNQSPVDSLVAMVAELTPTGPTHTFRYNSLPDSIPGDNLYAANYQIGRNNLLHFCTRYNGIRNHIGTGTMIGLAENWALMRDWSHQSNNIQCMQFSPEMNHLQISVKKNLPAYQQDSLVFDLNQLLNQTIGIREVRGAAGVNVYPNPTHDTFTIDFGDQQQDQTLSLTDFFGREIKPAIVQKDRTKVEVSLQSQKPGIYFIRGGKRQTFLGSIIRN